MRGLSIDRFRYGLTLALAALSCASSSPSGPVDESATRVLFIGNSLTYVNDLPGLVEAVARASGGDAISTRTVAFPDYSLEDHWNRGDALAAIDEGGWDYVVMQQGPSSLPESRENLVQWSERFGGRIRAAGGTPVLYMVWPSSDRIAFFDAVRESYRAGAEAAGGEFLPAGEAWRAAWEVDPDLALYSVDGFHPSLMGSVLAAFTFYDRLLGGIPGSPPTELTRPGQPPVRMSAALAGVLGRAATEANTRFP